jgi:hypothetical protein
LAGAESDFGGLELGSVLVLELDPLSLEPESLLGELSDFDSDPEDESDLAFVCDRLSFR